MTAIPNNMFKFAMFNYGMLKITQISLALIRETTTGDRHTCQLNTRWYFFMGALIF